MARLLLLPSTPEIQAQVLALAAELAALRREQDPDGGVLGMLAEGMTDPEPEPEPAQPDPEPDPEDPDPDEVRRRGGLVGGRIVIDPWRELTPVERRDNFDPWGVRASRGLPSYRPDPK
jgi:hypothetical protein